MKMQSRVESHPRSPRPLQVFGVRDNVCILSCLSTVTLSGVWRRDWVNSRSNLELIHHFNILIIVIFCVAIITPLLCWTTEAISWRPLKFSPLMEPNFMMQSPTFKPYNMKKPDMVKWLHLRYRICIFYYFLYTLCWKISICGESNTTFETSLMQ